MNVLQLFLLLATKMNLHEFFRRKRVDLGELLKLLVRSKTSCKKLSKSKRILTGHLHKNRLVETWMQPVITSQQLLFATLSDVFVIIFSWFVDVYKVDTRNKMDIIFHRTRRGKNTVRNAVLGIIRALKVFAVNIIEVVTLSEPNFKGCVCYICASLFLSLKESTFQTRKHVFYFTSRALFVLEKIKF